MTAPTGN